MRCTVPRRTETKTMARMQEKAIAEFVKEFKQDHADMMLDPCDDIYVARFNVEILGTAGSLIDLTCIDYVDGRYVRVQVGPKGRIFR